MVKKLLAILVITLMLIPGSITVRAAVPDTFTLDLAEVNDVIVKSVIQSLSINESASGWNLYVNNQLKGTSIAQNNSVSYSFDLDDLSFSLQFNTLTAKTTLRYSYDQISGINTLISLDTKGGENKITIYPDLTQTPIVITGQNTETETVFEPADITYRFQQHNTTRTMKVHYQFLLDRTADILHIKANDESFSVECEQGQARQTVFLEYHVDAHLLDLNYLAKLNSYKTFEKAKTIPYSQAEIGQIVRNEKITLVNSKTGLTEVVPIEEFIYHWKRLGKEDYSVAHDSVLQVVCQWQEDVCASTRQTIGQSNRTFAVFGTSYQFAAPRIYTTLEYHPVTEYSDWSPWLTRTEFNDDTAMQSNLETEKKEFMEYDYYSDWSAVKYSNTALENDLTHQVTTQYRYQTASWPAWSEYVYDTDTKTDCQDSTECQWSAATLYRKSVSSWGSWSDYTTSDHRDDCSDNQDCDYTSRTMYSRKTGTWGSYGDYQYASTTDQYKDCADSSDCKLAGKTMYAKVVATLTGKYGDWESSCSAGSTYRCQTYYKYVCHAFLSNTTVYSTSSYAVDSTGPCSGSAKVQSRTAGYRKAYVQYTSPASTAYKLTTCTASSGYYKCFAKTLYATAKRTWSSWSNYSYSSCKDTSSETSGTTYKCRNEKQYAYRYRTWSAYSPWTQDVCTERSDTRCLKQVFYATRYRQWGDYSGWSESTPPENNPDVRAQTRWSYRQRQKTGSGFGETVPIDGIYTGTAEYYRYRKMEQSLQQVEVARAALGTSELGTKEMMTEAEITALSNEIARAAIQAAIIEQMNGYVSLEDLDQAMLQQNATLQKVGEAAKQKFLESEIFVPYVYVTDHWRADYEPFDVETYQASWTYLKQYVNNQTNSISATMKHSDSSNSHIRIIYFDQSQPLAGYDPLPDNWIGKQELIQQITNANVSNADIVVTLSASDIAAIKQWVTNPDNDPDDFLLHFGYVIMTAPASFRQALAAGKE